MLLERFGLQASVFAPMVDEHAMAKESPQTLTARLARLKANAAAPTHPTHLILAGDTVVAFGNSVYGKPKHAVDAHAMLTSLCGKTHWVITGYCLLHAPSGVYEEAQVETKVRFRQADPKWLAWYAQSGEPMGKAGAYEVQGWGGLLLESLEGSYSNVIGFPIEHMFWGLWQKGWISL